MFAQCAWGGQSAASCKPAHHILFSESLGGGVSRPFGCLSLWNKQPSVQVNGSQSRTEVNALASQTFSSDAVT